MAIRWQDSSPEQILPILAGHAGPDVHIDPQAEAVVRAHLGSATVELGGLLVGRAWKGDDGAICHVAVDLAIPADESQGTSISLRMASSVWQRARDALGDGRLVVGWYHSHPGLTAFFSDTDRQTQAAFFAHDYSIGWVIDPLLDDEALFLGPACQPVRRAAAPAVDCPQPGR